MMPNKKAVKKPIAQKGSKTVKAPTKTEIAAQQALDSIKNNHEQLKKFILLFLVMGIAAGLTWSNLSQNHPVITKASAPIENKKSQVLARNTEQPDNGQDFPPSDISTNAASFATNKTPLSTAIEPATVAAVQPVPAVPPNSEPTPPSNTSITPPTAPVITVDPIPAPTPSLQSLVITVNNLVDHTIQRLLVIK